MNMPLRSIGEMVDPTADSSRLSRSGPLAIASEIFGRNASRRRPRPCS